MATQTVGAHRIFSTVSQADANAKALAQAQVECPVCLGVTTDVNALVWALVGPDQPDIMVIPNPPSGASFSVSGSMANQPGQTQFEQVQATICNATSSSVTIVVSVSGQSFNGASMSCHIATQDDGTHRLYQVDNGAVTVAGSSQSIVIAPNSTGIINIYYGMGPGLTLNPATFSGTILLTKA